MVIEKDTVVLSDAGGVDTYKLLSSEPNVVRAWRILIRGTVTASSQKVTLIANEITFEKEGVLDTSGNTGSPSWEHGVKPTRQVATDALGTTGSDGGDGGNAGDIQILALSIVGIVTVNAVGGSGGRGQDGGEGGPGRDYNGPQSIRLFSRILVLFLNNSPLVHRVAVAVRGERRVPMAKTGMEVT